MAIITLTTDFGTKDHFVAAIKGRILNELANVQIVDISHDIKPFNKQECAYILQNAFHEFPKESIHIIGVNSTLSQENVPIVVLFEGHYFIGANNGIISLIIDKSEAEQIAEINLPNMTKGAFPTLDIFTKVACHLARGGKMEVVSKPFNKLKQVKNLEPRIENNGKTIIGNVIYIDSIGNVVTNISKNIFDAYRNNRAFEIIARRYKLTKIHNSYDEIIDYNLPENQRMGESDFLAIFNSAGYIELAIYKGSSKGSGSASTLIGLKHQDQITLNFL